MKNNLFKFLIKNNKKSFKFYSPSMKYFGGGHHEITGKVDLDRQFVQQTSANKISGIVSLTGLSADEYTSHDTQIVEHGLPKLNQTNPFCLLHRPKHLAGVLDEDNPYIHDDFYGYTFFDDVSFFNNVFSFFYIISAI